MVCRLVALWDVATHRCSMPMYTYLPRKQYTSEEANKSRLFHGVCYINTNSCGRWYNLYRWGATEDSTLPNSSGLIGIYAARLVKLHSHCSDTMASQFLASVVRWPAWPTWCSDNRRFTPFKKMPRLPLLATSTVPIGLSTRHRS